MSPPFIYKPRPGEEISVSRDADGRCAVLVTSGTRTASARIGAGEAPGFAAMAAWAICEAAGKPGPVILERPAGEPDRFRGIKATRDGWMVLLSIGGNRDALDVGAARDLAARIAILADEAESQTRPRSRKLTRILRGIAPGMADPGEGDYKTAVVRPFAEAALRWMNGRQQRGGQP